MKNEIMTFLFYKDYKKEIEELIRYGDTVFSEIKYVTSPFIFRKYNDFIQFIWVYLVINYGDYGTSPFYGWVDNWKKASEFLKEILSNYEQAEDDL